MEKKPNALQEWKKGFQNAEKGKKGKFLVEFIKTHEDLRQVVFFFLFSLLCFAAEMASFYAIYYICRSVSYDAPFSWFVFDYTATESGGQGGFLAFLISTAIAQALTFVLNRKKTFNANNNVVFSAIMYAIMVVIIVVMNAALCGIIKDGIASAMLRGNCGESITDFISGTVSKMVGGALAWLISFFTSKFVIMRKKKEPTREKREESV